MTKPRSTSTSTDSLAEDKAKQSAEIAKQVAAFERKGGKITYVPIGIGSFDFASVVMGKKDGKKGKPGPRSQFIISKKSREQE